MPKDTDKYRYLQVGLGWDSWVLAQLTRDAEMHQMGDQPAKLAAVRLTEYYRLVDLGIIVPGVTVLVKREGSQEIEKMAQEKLTLTKRRSNTPFSSEAAVVKESTRGSTDPSASRRAVLESD